MIAPLRFGLVGTGIGHSLSPRLHEKAFELSGITGSYALLDCADASAALAVFAQLRLGDLDGLNVTTPFKALRSSRMGAPLSAMGRSVPSRATSTV